MQSLNQNPKHQSIATQNNATSLFLKNIAHTASLLLLALITITLSLKDYYLAQTVFPILFIATMLVYTILLRQFSNLAINLLRIALLTIAIISILSSALSRQSLLITILLSIPCALTLYFFQYTSIPLRPSIPTPIQSILTRIQQSRVNFPPIITRTLSVIHRFLTSIVFQYSVLLTIFCAYKDGIQTLPSCSNTFLIFSIATTLFLSILSRFRADLRTWFSRVSIFSILLAYILIDPFCFQSDQLTGLFMSLIISPLLHIYLRLRAFFSKFK